MNIQDRIEDLEQQMYVACSEGDYHSMNQIEQQLEQLRGSPASALLDDPYATESRWEAE
jgi:hypothetical protein